MDIESGYGRTPTQLAETVKRVLDIGVVGINLEDQIIGQNRLYSVSDQAARIEACRKSAAATGVPLFINARSDLYFQAKEDADETHLEREILARAAAYHQAGADGLFTPGLLQEKTIEALCAATSMPVNIMVMPDCPPLETLAKIGVSRISYGPGPYFSAMESLASLSKSAYGPAA
jgi:2-methylisocitrate lyase-like PEP mutase family enzyme